MSTLPAALGTWFQYKIKSSLGRWTVGLLRMCPWGAFPSHLGWPLQPQYLFRVWVVEDSRHHRGQQHPALCTTLAVGAQNAVSGCWVARSLQDTCTAGALLASLQGRGVHTFCCAVGKRGGRWIRQARAVLVITSQPHGGKPPGGEIHTTHWNIQYKHPLSLCRLSCTHGTPALHTTHPSLCVCMLPSGAAGAWRALSPTAAAARGCSSQARGCWQHPWCSAGPAKTGGMGHSAQEEVACRERVVIYKAFNTSAATVSLVFVLPDCNVFLW